MIYKRLFFVVGLIVLLLWALLPVESSVQGTYGGTTYEESAVNGTFRTETISAGTLHTCAIQADGTATCWGDIFNTHGQANADVGIYLQITAGDKHTCAIRENGTVNCWGDNTYGVLTPPDDAAIYQQVSAGSNFTCGLLADGTLSCWGAEDGYGQVSDAPESTVFTQVSAGYQHACGILPNGNLTCWGRNLEGQAPASTTGPFLQVSSGKNHTCAIKGSDRSVQCWGDNTGGKATPTATGPFLRVSSGAYHTCAIAAQSTPLEGNLICWGATPADPPDPAETFTQIAAGTGFNCGILADGTTACWGAADDGQTAPPSDITSLGTAQYNLSLGSACMITTGGSVKCVGAANTMVSETPTTGTFTQISSTYTNTCGIKSDGSLICWGYLSTNEAGPYIQVSASTDHACALRPNGVVNCWGSNFRGKSTPPASTYFRQIAVGQDHFTCGIKMDNTLACWGGLSNGVIDPPPTGTYTQIGAGWYHACAIQTDGAMQCWGNSLYGTTVAPTGTFKQVSGGKYSNCAIRTDNTALCWGYSDGANNPPAGLYRQISDDGVEACGIKTNGTLVCWGTNYSGEAPRLTITPATLTGGTTTVAYSQQLTSSGGTAPIKFSRSSGTLPPGLSLSSAGLLSGTPNTGGTYTFTVQVRDSFYINVEALRTYTVYINRPPSAADQVVTTNEDNAKAINLSASDPDSDALVWTVGNPAHGTLSGTVPNLTYTPAANWFGVDTFTFRVNDGKVNSRTATVTVNVSAVNDAPLPPAQADVLWKTKQAQSLVISPFTDVDSASLTYTARLHSGAALPAWLSFTPATRTFSGTPAAANKGQYVLDVVASDGQKSGTLTFTLTVVDEHRVLLPIAIR